MRWSGSAVDGMWCRFVPVSNAVNDGPGFRWMSRLVIDVPAGVQDLAHHRASAPPDSNCHDRPKTPRSRPSAPLPLCLPHLPPLKGELRRFFMVFDLAENWQTEREPLSEVHGQESETFALVPFRDDTWRLSPSEITFPISNLPSLSPRSANIIFESREEASCNAGRAYH